MEDILSNRDKHKDDLKERLADWSSYTTAHGIPRIFGNTTVLVKIVWITFVTISWTACAYLIIKSLLQYLKYEVNVNVELVEESPSYFPVIDICNLSPYNGNTLGKDRFNLLNITLNASIPDYPYSDDLSANRKRKVFKYTKISKELLSVKYAKIRADSMIRTKLNELEHHASRGRINLTEIGYQMSDMLLSCKFQGQYCSANDFSMYHNYYYGNCFRFNGGLNAMNQKIPFKKSTKPGWRYGLQIELFTGRRNILSYSNGFRILVTNQTRIKVFPEEEGLNVAPGFLTNVAIEKTNIEKLPAPFNDCIDNLRDTKFDYLIDNSLILRDMKYQFKYKLYDQQVCLKMCLQRYIYFYCNCTDFTLPLHTVEKLDSGCNSLTDVVCATAAEAEFFNTDAVNRCRKLCPDKCSFSKYDVRVSSSRFPTDWYHKTQNLSLSMENYRKHIALVNIFYDDMLYTRIIQNPQVTSEQLFGNLGGTLGLFMGISLLSTIEVIELIIILHIFAYGKLFKKKK